MQFEKRGRDAEPVGGIYELEILAFQLGWSVIVRGKPSSRIHNVLDAD